MTVLDNKTIPSRSKLSTSKRVDAVQVKRKLQQDSEDSSSKRFSPENKMLNGYIKNEQRGENSVSSLSNMGNTCYLNSVLYSLRFAPRFLHNLHHLIADLSVVNSKLDIKPKTSSLGRNISGISLSSGRSTSSKDLLSLGGANSAFIPKSKVQIVTEKLHELYANMRSSEVRENCNSYQPVDLLQAVREANDIFEGNNQQDAHELLVHLLDNIRETCDFLTQLIENHPNVLETSDLSGPVKNTSKLLWPVRRVKQKTNKSVIPENSKDFERTSETSSTNGDTTKKINYNFLTSDFEGVTLRRTKCLECESVTERKETFYDIPVPVNFKDDDTDLRSMATSEIYKKACVTSEKLCDANKYLCEKCERYNEASREVHFERLPNIMILQLKRFTSTSAGVQKVTSFLPTPLDLTCFCITCLKSENPQHKYELSGVIMHLGGSMASGHYITYVKQPHAPFDDYFKCERDLATSNSNLATSTSDKSLNILKFFKPSRNPTNNLNLNSMCRGFACCALKCHSDSCQINNQSEVRSGDGGVGEGGEWLECDDDVIRRMTDADLLDLLAYKPNSTSTPYLLFYSKVVT